MRFREFKLVEGYKEVTQKFAQEADAEQVKKVIAQYRDLVNRNQVQGNERNIDWWSKQGWESFQKFVNAKSQQQSQTQQKKRKKTGQSYTLAENDQWLIVVPLDKDASCFHGKGTDWCTTKPDHDYFEQYFRDDNVTLIYFLQKQTGAKWAAAVYPNGEADFFDKNDNSIGNRDLADQTGIPLDTVMKYVRMVSDSSTDVAKKASSSRDTMQFYKDQLEDLINSFVVKDNPTRDPKIETLLLKVKHAPYLRRYMYELLNHNDTVSFDQNMQTLIASQLPFFIEKVGNVSEKTQRQMVKRNPELIKYIVNPSEEIAIYVVEQDPWAISDINNPSDKVINLAIEKTPHSIMSKKLLQNANWKHIAKATDLFIKEEIDENGSIKVPTLSEWLQQIGRTGIILDKEFYKWLMSTYDELAERAISVYFITKGEADHQEIVDQIVKKHPEIESMLKNLELADL